MKCDQQTHRLGYVAPALVATATTLGDTEARPERRLVHAERIPIGLDVIQIELYRLGSCADPEAYPSRKLLLLLVGETGSASRRAFDSNDKGLVQLAKAGLIVQPGALPGMVQNDDSAPAWFAVDNA